MITLKKNLMILFDTVMLLLQYLFKYELGRNIGLTISAPEQYKFCLLKYEFSFNVCLIVHRKNAMYGRQCCYLSTIYSFRIQLQQAIRLFIHPLDKDSTEPELLQQVERVISIDML